MTNEKKLIGTQGDRSGDLRHAKVKPYHCSIGATIKNLEIIYSVFNELLMIRSIRCFFKKHRGPN